MVYHRDRLGRVIQKDSHWADNTHSESSRYFYDKLSRVTRAHNAHSEIRLSYNSKRTVAPPVLAYYFGLVLSIYK
ncbi:hypothetical protein ACLSYZ_11170 [Avibacterium avium]|uniref:hypothetical protein n=1 Tax=Avibacterium TaxID=292486 RepID=UPI0039FD56F9